MSRWLAPGRPTRARSFYRVNEVLLHPPDAEGIEWRRLEQAGLSGANSSRVAVPGCQILPSNRHEVVIWPVDYTE